jgi:transposase InsO family protein
MTDNGSAYRSHAIRHAIRHAFRHACAAARLRHVRTRPYTPRTNGKAERFILTALREWAYASPTPARANTPWPSTPSCTTTTTTAPTPASTAPPRPLA